MCKKIFALVLVSLPSPSTHILVRRVTETDYNLSAGKWSFTRGGSLQFLCTVLDHFFSSAQNKLLLDQFFHLQVCPFCELCRLCLWQPQRNIWWTWSLSHFYQGWHYLLECQRTFNLFKLIIFLHWISSNVFLLAVFLFWYFWCMPHSKYALIYWYCIQPTCCWFL